MDMVLPMNTGAEAVESAIKVARAWGYRVKGVMANKAKIIVAKENFHGRTISIVSFSTDESSKKDFGPFTPGFVSVPYGDADALEKEIDANTVAVLIEPIQGEAGIITPPKGYLKKVRALTKANNVLMIADEIQSGLGRTGATVQCNNEKVVPDMYILGKALGGWDCPGQRCCGAKRGPGCFEARRTRVHLWRESPCGSGGARRGANVGQGGHATSLPATGETLEEKTGCFGGQRCSCCSRSGSVGRN